MVREAVERHGFVGIKVHRHDARITREVCEVARAYALPVLYDVMGEVAGRRAPGREYPGGALHHPAPRQLRRRLARPARAHRPPGPPPQRVRGHLRRAPLRPAGTGRAPGGARRRSSSAPTAPGCTRGSSSRRSAPCGSRPPTRRSCSRAELPSPHRARASRPRRPPVLPRRRRQPLTGFSAGPPPPAIPAAVRPLRGWRPPRGGSPELQGPVGDPETAGGALEIALLFSSPRAGWRSLPRRVRRPSGQRPARARGGWRARTARRATPGGHRPTRAARPPGRRRPSRLRAHVPAHDAERELSKLTDVARVLAPQEASCDRSRRAGAVSRPAALPDEVAGQGQDVLGRSRSGGSVQVQLAMPVVEVAGGTDRAGPLRASRGWSRRPGGSRSAARCCRPTRLYECSCTTRRSCA